MQMKFCYERGTRAQRAARLRQGAQELERAGFRDFAEINREMAEYLDPYVSHVDPRTD